jgi:hypothetical protein
MKAMLLGMERLAAHGHTTANFRLKAPKQVQPLDGLLTIS